MNHFTWTIMGAVFGFLFGVCFFSGLAFLMGYQIYYEESDSMTPVIEKGSLLLVRKSQEKESYRKGEIVVFCVNYRGQPLCVTHRIVDKREDNRGKKQFYIMKGDANAEADRCFVTESAILGKVMGQVPFFGFVCAWIKEHEDMVMLLFLIILVRLGRIRQCHKKKTQTEKKTGSYRWNIKM